MFCARRIKTLLQDRSLATIVSRMIIYTDAHCHLNPQSENPTIDCRIYSSVRPADWKNAIIISENDDDKNFAAIGIHPWYLADVDTNFESQMIEILTEHPNMMVGEIGLDKFHPDIPHQLEIFVAQLKIAAKLRRPIHLHCVGAWDKILHIFKHYEHTLPPVIVAHNFNGSPDLIQQIAERYNVYFSYSVPHDNSQDITRISTTPPDRILVETDTFDLNDEIDKLDAAISAIALINQSDIDEMSEKIYQNIQRVISYVRSIE
ncbi:MAG: TatD family hydrolase [Alphaproteobacteria bacterium]|nr:TatD family hydrolase [Alphaproteobacteria bacterium]